MKRKNKEILFVKYVRASAKVHYHKAKKDKCFICGSTKDLELHHVIPLSEIVWSFLEDKGIKNPTNNVELRQELLDKHKEEIYSPENLITLCRLHHLALHQLFGKTYNRKVAEKVSKYLTKRKEKWLSTQMNK